MTTEVLITDLSVDYGTTRALHSVSLAIDQGEVLALIGPSGCGKSTLLRAIAGLVDTAEGTIQIGGRDVTRLPSSRRRVGLVPQNYAMFPHMTVVDNIAYGLRARRQSKAQVTARVAEMLELTHLQPYAERRPDELSGGQRQRVALARALAIDPDVVLLDEPLSALDPQLRGGLRRELATLIEKAGYTTIVVTHDQSEAMALGHKIAILNEGRLVQHAEPQTLWAAPADPFVADFLAGALMMPAELHGALMVTLGGQWGIPAAHLAGDPATATRVLLRPDSLQLNEQAGPETVTGEVTSAEFAGDSTRLRVRLTPEIACDVLVDAEQQFGRTVHLSVKPGLVAAL